MPLEVNYFGTKSRVHKGTQEYEEAIKQLPGYRIKEAMQPFFDKIGIRKDIIVVEDVNPGLCAAVGTNDFTQGDATIFVTPNLKR